MFHGHVLCGRVFREISPLTQLPFEIYRGEELVSFPGQILNTKYRAPVYLFPRHYSSSFRPLYFFSHSKFLFNSIVIYQNDLYNYP